MTSDALTAYGRYCAIMGHDPDAEDRRLMGLLAGLEGDDGDS